MTVVDLYTVQIISDMASVRPLHSDMKPGLDALMAETQENLNDLLANGYSVRIRRWDDLTDEPTQEDDDA